MLILKCLKLTLEGDKNEVRLLTGRNGRKFLQSLASLKHDSLTHITRDISIQTLQHTTLTHFSNPSSHEQIAMECPATNVLSIDYLLMLYAFTVLSLLKYWLNMVRNLASREDEGLKCHRLDESYQSPANSYFGFSNYSTLTTGLNGREWGYLCKSSYGTRDLFNKQKLRFGLAIYALKYSTIFKDLGDYFLWKDGWPACFMKV